MFNARRFGCTGKYAARTMADEIQVHLQMIQGVVTRMGTNSFFLKGWGVILVAALLALAANTDDSLVFVLTYLPILAFWGLDGYYLWKERQYRDLYNHVRNKDQLDLHYDLDVKISAEARQQQLLRAVFSWTPSIFYGTMFVVVTVILTIRACGGE